MPADPVYVQLLDEILDLHHEKSGGYGTEADPLANFTAIAEASGEPAWRYPRRRALEKLTRIESLERQGRLDELAQEHLDIASLMLCAEVLRRRATDPAGEPVSIPSTYGAPRPHPSPSPAVHSPADLPALIGQTTLVGGAALRSPSPQPAHHPGSGLSAADATTLFTERLRELADALDYSEVADDPLSLYEQRVTREISDALRTASDLIGLSTSVESPYVAPCAQPPERSDEGPAGKHPAHTPCKSPVFRSDRTDAEILERRIGAGDGQDTTGVGRHTPSPAHEPARLRDAQRGDDGWVRA